MDVEGKYSRTLHLEDEDESLGLQDVADLAEAALSLEALTSGPSSDWTTERVERARGIIEEVRGIE